MLSNEQRAVYGITVEGLVKKKHCQTLKMLEPVTNA